MVVKPESLNAHSPMEVTLLGIVTFVKPLQASNAHSPMEVTGRPLIALGMTKVPVALGLLPVIVMAVPSLVNNNSALEVAVNVSSTARAQALKFFNSRLTVGELLGNCWFGDVCSFVYIGCECLNLKICLLRSLRQGIIFIFSGNLDTSMPPDEEEESLKGIFWKVS